MAQVRLQQVPSRTGSHPCTSQVTDPEAGDGRSDSTAPMLPYVTEMCGRVFIHPFNKWFLSSSPVPCAVSRMSGDTHASLVLRCTSVDVGEVGRDDFGVRQALSSCEISRWAHCLSEVQFSHLQNRVSCRIIAG